MDNFTWAPIMPLIGGFPIGSEQAFGKPPEEIISYAGVGNDQQYIHYQNEIKGRGLSYTILDEDDYEFDRKINVIVGTPACSGLSQLNTGKTEEAKGANAEKNKYMYMIFEHGMKKYDADVVMLENAPALATKKGEPVADRLFEICQENGYSLTLYKTSTHFHGIPQRRDRTFAIAWKSENAPIMEFQNVQHKSFADYLKEIPEWATLQEVINPKIPDDCAYWNYIKDKEGNPRDSLRVSNNNTCFNHVNKKYELKEVAQWIRENGTDRQTQLVEHALNKFSQGLGIWDGSVHVFHDVMNAVIGRNLADSVHPTEDRSLTIREAMHMMGMPHDMELLGGKRNTNMIAQNVPTCTARFISEQVVKHLKGELPYFNSPYVKQDNWNRKNEFRVPETDPATLEEFF